MKSAVSLALLSLVLANSALANEPSSAITLALNSSNTAIYSAAAKKSAADAINNSIELEINKAVQDMSTQLNKELEEKIAKDLKDVMP